MKVVVTGIAGDLGQSAAAVLRAHYPGAHIVGTDLHEQHAGSLVTDEVVVCPPAASSTYATWMEDLCAKLGADVLIPCSDAEILVLSALDPSVLPPTIMPNREVVAVGQDKLATAQYLNSHGFLSPRTVPADETDSIAYPCILKPRSGQGSRNVFLVKNQAEADRLAGIMTNGILQELLEPASEEITCAVLRLDGGSPAVLALRRRLAGGSTVWAEVIDDPDVTDYCAGIADALQLHGPMNIQLVRTADGPKAFEINARLSSTVAMRDVLGFHDLYWAIENALRGVVPIATRPVAGSQVTRLSHPRLLAGS